MRSGIVLAVGVLVSMATRSEAAKLVVINTGSTISFITYLKGERLEQAATLFPPGVRMPDAAVGYHHEHFGLFWIDLWTWNGKWCIYERDTAVEISKEQAAQLLGTPVDELRKPFFYRYPGGLFFLFLLVCVFVVVFVPLGFYLEHKDRQLLEAARADPRYQHALQLYQQGEATEKAFEEAVLSLEQNGIARPEATKTLRALLGLKPPE